MLLFEGNIITQYTESMQNKYTIMNNVIAIKYSLVLHSIPDITVDENLDWKFLSPSQWNSSLSISLRHRLSLSHFLH